MRVAIGLVACVAVLIGGCGYHRDSGSPATGGKPTTGSASGSGSAGAGSAETASTAQRSGASSGAGGGIAITIAASPFGPVLFDGSGQAIYTFGAEKSSKPTCYGECAVAWPPVLTDGRPAARGAVNVDLLGVTARRDGSAQVTYGGKPLYFYAREGKHVVLCHDVREFGGLWLAITAAGSPAPTPN